jgi:PGF-pre-PGF domain-containing protein
MNQSIKRGLFFIVLTLVLAYFSFALTFVGVISPTAGENVSGNLLLNATTNESAVNVTFYWYDSTTGILTYNTTFVNDTGNVFNTTINSSLITDGIYNITVNATNSTGIVVTNASMTGVTVDNTVPVVTAINTPISNANLSTGNQLFNVTVNDTTVGMDTVRFNITNSSGSVMLNASEVVSGYWNVTYNVSLLAEESHTATVLANDTLGNLNNSATVTFIVDRTAPNITLETANATSTTDTTPTISFNFTDALSSTADCTLYRSGTSYGTNSAVSNATSTSITFNTILSATIYTYTINCTDSAGNLGTSVTNTITVTETTTSSTSSSSSGGSVDQQTTQSAKAIWGILKSGEPATVEVKDASVGITGVTFNAAKNLYGMWMKVEKKDTLPNKIAEPIEKVYTYVEITKSLFLDNEDMLDPTITFKVAKSWLTENGLSKGNVALLRYVDGEWQDLTTTLVDDDSDYIYYSAETPGFSYFAIGQKLSSLTVTKEDDSKVEETSGVEKVVTEEETVTGETSVKEAEETEEGEEVVEEKSIWPATILVLILLILGYFGWYFFPKIKKFVKSFK